MSEGLKSKKAKTLNRKPALELTIDDEDQPPQLSLDVGNERDIMIEHKQKATSRATGSFGNAFPSKLQRLLDQTECNAFRNVARFARP